MRLPRTRFPHFVSLGSFQQPSLRYGTSPLRLTPAFLIHQPRHGTAPFCREHEQQHSRDWDWNRALARNEGQTAWMARFSGDLEGLWEFGLEHGLFFLRRVKRVNRFYWGIFWAWEDFFILGYWAAGNMGWVSVFSFFLVTRLSIRRTSCLVLSPLVNGTSLWNT